MGKQHRLNRISSTKADAGVGFFAGISRLFFFALSLLLLCGSIAIVVERPDAKVWAAVAFTLSIVLFVFAMFASDKTMIDAGPNP